MAWATEINVLSSGGWKLRSSFWQGWFLVSSCFLFPCRLPVPSYCVLTWPFSLHLQREGWKGEQMSSLESLRKTLVYQDRAPPFWPHLISSPASETPSPAAALWLQLRHRIGGGEDRNSNSNSYTFLRQAVACVTLCTFFFFNLRHISWEPYNFRNCPQLWNCYLIPTLNSSINKCCHLPL